MNKLLKSILPFIILIILPIKSVFSQPFIYYLGNVVDSVDSYSLYNLKRINLQNESEEIFMDRVFETIVLDGTQSWLAEGQFPIGFQVYNCNDTSINFIVPWEVQPIESILYSPIKNRLYLFGSFNNQDSVILSVINLETKVEEANIKLPIRVDEYNYSEAFFSLDNNTMYFLSEDTSFNPVNPKKNKITYFSTISNIIFQERDLSQIGYPNADGYFLYKGYNGKGIVQSFFWNQSNDSYFRIYNFDKDTGSIFIKHQGFAVPYFTGDDKYLVLASTTSIGGIDFNSGEINIYSVSTGSKVKSIILSPKVKIYTFENYPDKFYYKTQDLPQFVPFELKSITTPTISVKLINSNGSKLTSGSLQYFEGGWKDAVNNNDGTFTIDTQLKTISLRMTYEYGTQTKSNVPVGADTIIFQTVNAQVQLKNSMNELMPALTGNEGIVQYYAGAWRTFGSTVNGIASKELLPGNYSFRMSYAYASKDKQQDIGTNPVVVFQTVAANVQLKNSMNEWLNGGVVQYYSGAWREFGTASNGIATKELLPNNYSFRMTYAYASKDKQQNIETNPTIVFQTVAANVQLQNSLGNLIDHGTVQYYSGAWREFGTTSNGVVTKELLPNNYSFIMTYEYVSNDKAQDIGFNPIVNFATVLCTIRVKDAQSNPVNNAQASYYSGAWRQIGNTVYGEITKELLPANLTFRIKLGTTQNDKTQNLAVNNLVEFSLP